MFRSPDEPLDEFLKQARAIGFRAVEIWDRGMYKDWRAVIETARRHDLTLCSMGGHGSLHDGLNKPENHSRIEAELRESIDIASEHDIAGLICFSGNRNPGQSDDEGLIACSAGLKRIAPYAEEKGINLNIELLNSRVDHYNYQADHTDWGVALCEMVNSPRVKLLYDIYHMQIMEGDIIRTIRKHVRWIGHLHTAGNPGRNDLDDSQELNYRAICRAIAESGYDLYVGHEYRPKADAIASLKAAFDICNKNS
jgi:hydroxypyruvate isomerase